MSLVESIANIAVGYCLAVVTQLLAFPHFGLKVTITDTLAIGAVFTVVSIGRSYCLRRLFEALRAQSVRSGQGS